MRSRRLNMRALSTLLALAWLVGACAPAPPSSPAPAPPTSAASKPAATSGPTSAPAAAPTSPPAPAPTATTAPKPAAPTAVTQARSGGSVTVNMYQKWAALNPFQTSADTVPMQLSYEALVFINGDNVVTSRLADISASADAKTFTFKLKPGLKWSDGEPFTSADVLFNFNNYANPKISIFSGVFDGVTGVADFRNGTSPKPTGFDVPDAATFSIRLDQPYAPFLVRLANPILYLIPEHLLRSMPPDQLKDNANPFWQKPVGLGPFQLVRNEADQFLEFNRNPNYVTPVKLDKVFVKSLAADVAAASLEAGDMDLAQIGVTDADRLKGNSKIQVVTQEGIQPIYLVPNLDKPYFKDKRVRQGIMQALPRKQIVETALGGQASVPLTYPFGPGWAIGPNLNAYDFDVSKAKQLLTDGGWEFDRTVTIDLVPGPKDRERVLDIVAGQLQAMGIKLQVRLLQAGPFLQARKDGTFDLSMSGGEIGDIDPALMFVAVRCGGYYKDGKGTNFANYCNEQLDDLFTRGQQTTVQTERATLYKQATQIMNQDMPYLLLYVPKTLYAVSSRLQGFKPDGDFTHAYWNAADWSISQ